MVASAIIGGLLVFGLFLSMLSSAPKGDGKWHSDTDA